LNFSAAKPIVWQGLSGQAFATLGAACIDHSTATTGFHANQKAVCACAASFRGLVSAFHFESFLISDPQGHMAIFLGETGDYRKLSRGRQTFSARVQEKNAAKAWKFWFMMAGIG
jgi:hypothetical protein